MAGRPRGGDFPWRGAGAVAAVGAPLGRRRHIGAFQNLCRSGRPVSPDIQHHVHDGVRHARSGAGRKPPAASASRRDNRNIATAVRPLRSWFELTTPTRSRRCSGFTPHWWRPPCRRMTSSCLHSRAASANNTGPRPSCTRHCSAFDGRPACGLDIVHRLHRGDGAVGYSGGQPRRPRHRGADLFGLRHRTAHTQMVSRADGPFAAGAVGPGIRI